MFTVYIILPVLYTLQKYEINAEKKHIFRTTINILIKRELFIRASRGTLTGKGETGKLQTIIYTNYK
ncbi:MAG TPA: hypothetical protein DEQ06_03775 [Porphyromonadaceae bacterium]|nr:hypothetical protein [Porphyromonadaceae bacterium]